MNPYRVKILIFGADRKHHLSGIERGKYVRLVILSQLGFKSDPRIKYLIALFGKNIINIMRKLAVNSALSAFVTLLIADENIKWLLVFCNIEYFFLEPVYLLRFCSIHRMRNAIRPLQSLLKIAVIENTVI